MSIALLRSTFLIRYSKLDLEQQQPSGCHSAVAHGQGLGSKLGNIIEVLPEDSLRQMHLPPVKPSEGVAS